MFAWAVALAGGLFAVVAAIFEEAAYASPLIAILIGPAIEEVLKPSGVLYLFSKRPEVLRSRLQVTALSASGGLVFATIENLIYVFLYTEDPSPGYVTFRFTVCTALHVLCSGALGWGISGQLAAVRSGEKKFELDDSLPWAAVAIGIHAAYNTAVMLLAVADVKLY